MCGLTACISRKGINKEEYLTRVIEKMNKSLTHRGPDKHGIWCDAKSGIALGHRRLSIIDLSKNGDQPMHSSCGRYVIVYNGEAYNYLTIKKELEEKGYSFKGHSDTETIISAISEFGVEQTVNKLNGMFAFCVWDKQQRVIHLVRDRIGKKPLYYGWANNVFMVASELKAFHANPEFRPDIEHEAISLFFKYSCIPAPFSIYKGIYKLPPGSVLSLEYECLINGVDSKFSPYPNPESGVLGPKKYWTVFDFAERGEATELNTPTDEIEQQLRDILLDSVSARLIADVPLGAFLSGGIDSSLIVALMQSISSRAVKTFSIGFEDEYLNEADSAKQIASYLGTEHTELYVSDKDAIDVIPLLASVYDEPFADSSQIPTYIVSKLARSSVKVVLSGDGGDELFGGYNRYIQAVKMWNYINRVPWGVRRLWQCFSPLLGRDKGFLSLEPLIGRIDTVHRKLESLESYLAAKTFVDFYDQYVGHWLKPEKMVNGNAKPNMKSKIPFLPKDGCFVEKMMFYDQMKFLPDYVLVKVDRASMANSLEVRNPLLDHTIIEFSWSVPTSLKITGRQSKIVLKKILFEYVPEEFFQRPKRGFSIPINEWIKGPLRDWAEELLREDRLKETGYLNSSFVRKYWEIILKSEEPPPKDIWDILMFQSWIEHWK